jgi:hypothetical protein
MPISQWGAVGGNLQDGGRAIAAHGARDGKQLENKQQAMPNQDSQQENHQWVAQSAQTC